MAASCDQRNPLARSGLNQDVRFLRALDPDFIDVDERSTADLILFAQRFSRHLKFYDANNQEDGDWLPFFSNDISAVLARLSKVPVASLQAFFRGLQEYLTDDPSRPDADLSAHFKLAFYLPLLVLKDAGEDFARLPRDHALRAFTETVVARDIETPLRDLIAFYKGAISLAPPVFADTPPDLTGYNIDFDDLDPRIQLPTVVTERLAEANVLSAFDIDGSFIAAIAPAGWPDLFTDVDADPGPYVDSAGNIYDQIFDALNYNLLVKAFDRLFQAVERIALEAAKYLEISLTEFEEHTPHYGLWLAFLRLFGVSQDHLNELTERHLDYYYKDVLQLCVRDAEPDKAHLLFELSKTIDEYLLEAESTRFKAGKDETGKEVSYLLDSDFVVNRAQVHSLKSLFQPKARFLGVDFLLPFAAPVTNSRDGQGEDLPKDAPKWKPFGPVAGLPNARIGFALADRQLFLRDGTRLIAIAVKLEGTLPAMFFPPGFKASLTVEDGWLDISGPPKLVTGIMPGPYMLFLILLDGEDAAVIPYDEAIHGEGFSADEPVVKIEFDFENSPLWSVFLYTFLKDIRFESVELIAFVHGVRNILLQNDQSVVDAAKPFLAFGPTPEVGSSLILGSSELFSKRLANMTLNVTWEKLLTIDGFFRHRGPLLHTASVRHLKAGHWQSVGSPNTVALFAEGNQKAYIFLSALDDLSHSIPQTLENEPFSSTSTAGFIRLDLQEDFGHGEYIDEKTKALIMLAGGATTPAWGTDPANYNYDTENIPLEPYTPKITEISVSYATVLASPASFIHLLPFGHKTESVTTGRLFPETPNEGELYIGVKDLAPPQRLSMLFQAVPGTANPLKGENTLRWEYLRGNDWIAFEDQKVDDKTNNLTGPGIVGLAIPEDADTDHTVLPTGLHWFRMSAESDADAHTDLLLIAAQAASVTFLDQDNDPGFVATPLAAGTISKLKVGSEAIKKISQPYHSFGGKPQETDEHFYTRVSERLRHKDRAVTMWDYEHLVLESFPKVYLVKCVNHTELCRNADNEIVADNELKPGHVLVVTVPYVSSGGAVDPLRPYTDKQTQIAIDRFLRQRISPFVQLEVNNPKIEEVQVKFQVAFTDDVADIVFYKTELESAVIRYLTPWAYDEGADVSFGGKWHKSAITDFVEELSYIDYVKDVEMYHRADISEINWNQVDEEVVQATTARSILVSYPTHIIDEIV